MFIKKKSNHTQKRVRKPNDQKITSELSIWIILASVLPVGTLSFIGFCYVIGLDTWVEILIVVSLTAFLSISSVWWWRNLSTMIHIANILKTANQQFEEILKSIDELKKDIEKVKRSSRK